MRVSLAASIALACLQFSSAQTTGGNATLSSIVGPYTTGVLMFMPQLGREVSDWFLSALGTGGPDDPNGESTTWGAAPKFRITGTPNANTKTLFESLTFTIGPTTYIQSETNPSSVPNALQYSTMIHSFSGDVVPGYLATSTRLCSLTTIAPKASVVGEWTAQDFKTLLPDNFYTRTAICTQNATSNIAGTKVSTWFETFTYPDGDWYYGWESVTVLGSFDDPYTRTQSSASIPTGPSDASLSGSAAKITGAGTEEGKSTSTQAAGAAEVTAWVQAVVVVAAAAALAI